MYASRDMVIEVSEVYGPIDICRETTARNLNGDEGTSEKWLTLLG
jgi:hypothetical protein